MIPVGLLAGLLSWIAVVPPDDRDPPPSPSSLLGTGKLDASHARHIQALIKEFQDPDATRRHEKIASVVRVGDAAIPFLRDRIQDTSNPLVQRAALLALAEIGGTASAATTRQLLAADVLRDEELAVAALAFAAVQRGPDPAASDLLVQIASSKKPGFARRAAMLALGRLVDRDGLSRAIGESTRDALDDQRVAALIAAAACSDARFTPLALDGLEDRADSVRRAACLVLAESGDSSGTDRLLKLVRTDRSEAVIVAAVLALGRGSDARSLAAVHELVAHDDASVRQAAWSAIAARNDGAALVATAFERNKDPEVLARLAYACAESPAAALSQPLQALLTHARAEVRTAAGCALAARGDLGAEARLVLWLKGERDPQARAVALLVAGALGLPSAREVVRGNGGSALTGPGLADRLQAVQRTLDGRRDPRLLRDELMALIRGQNAREIDLRTTLFGELVAFVFNLDTLDRVRLVAGKPNSGGEGGGGDDGGGDGGTEGPFGGLLGKGKVDRKNSVIERDLEFWFDRQPFFMAREPIR